MKEKGPPPFGSRPGKKLLLESGRSLLEPAPTAARVVSAHYSASTVGDNCVVALPLAVGAFAVLPRIRLVAIC